MAIKSKESLYNNYIYNNNNNKSNNYCQQIRQKIYLNKYSYNCKSNQNLYKNNRKFNNKIFNIDTYIHIGIVAELYARAYVYVYICIFCKYL